MTREETIATAKRNLNNLLAAPAGDDLPKAPPGTRTPDFNRLLAAAIILHAQGAGAKFGSLPATLDEMEELEGWPLELNQEALAGGVLEVRLSAPARSKVRVDITRPKHWGGVQQSITPKSPAGESAEKPVKTATRASGRPLQHQRQSTKSAAAKQELTKAAGPIAEETNANWWPLSRMATTLATTGHYDRDGVIPGNNWGGTSLLKVKLGDQELPLRPVVWESRSRHTMKARAECVLRFLEIDKPDEGALRSFVEDIIALYGARKGGGGGGGGGGHRR